MPLTHQHQLDKLPRPDPLAEAFHHVDHPALYDCRLPNGQPYCEAKATSLSRALDAAGYEVRPKLTAERLAWALALHTEQPTIEWWDPETMNLVEMTWAEFAAAILAALAAEADDA